MGLIDDLYSKEDVSLRSIWGKHPFTLFDPAVRFVGYKEVKNALASRDSSFFINNVRNNFFPDKTEAEVQQATINAINRGVQTLNSLCKKYVPAHYDALKINTVAENYNALDAMTNAQSALLHAKNGLHRAWHVSPSRKAFYEANPGRLEKDLALHRQKSRALLNAYDAVRAWGLGHFILIIDEAPETFHSLEYRDLVSRWFDEKFNFRNPHQASNGLYVWENNSGIPIYSADRFSGGFRQRAKIRDEFGNIKYSSLLMKMFLKNRNNNANGVFPDGIYDAAGIEIVVENERDVKGIIDYFRKKIRCSGSLEKFEQVEDTNPPYKATKFLLRAPVRVAEGPRTTNPRPESCLTVELPQQKYMRVPVEVQVRHVQDVDHHEYKRQQYMKVFPLWYPRQIYEPILSELS